MPGSRCNPASVALHEAIGMRRIGVYERVGFKLGAWHDVAWYGLRLTDPQDVPPEPIPLPESAAEGLTLDLPQAPCFASWTSCCRSGDSYACPA